MKYSISEQVLFTELDGEYLAYSGKTGETLVIEEYAYDILNYLSGLHSFAAILRMIAEKTGGNPDGEFETLLRNTLDFFISRGYIETAGN